jgi:hypothetical protein
VLARLHGRRSNPSGQPIDTVAGNAAIDPTSRPACQALAEHLFGKPR